MRILQPTSPPSSSSLLW